LNVTFAKGALIGRYANLNRGPYKHMALKGENLIIERRRILEGYTKLNNGLWELCNFTVFTGGNIG